VSSNRRRVADIDFVELWPHAGEGEHEPALLRFWSEEKAFADIADARRRLREVVLYARDRDGEVAAVCTAVPMILPRLGEPMYYYRCLIGQAWRSTQLVMAMLRRACVVLEDYAVAQAYPCIGIVLELENDAFGKSLDSPVWPNPEQRGFVYIGKSRHGLDLRIAYFRGSRLTRAAVPTA
jgi:hypothetical protein